MNIPLSRDTLGSYKWCRILNYKSQNSVYYGDIQSINITKEGTDYDVIHPPILNVVDETGFGVTGKTNVQGSLSKLILLIQDLDTRISLR